MDFFTVLNRGRGTSSKVEGHWLKGALWYFRIVERLMKLARGVGTGFSTSTKRDHAWRRVWKCLKFGVSRLSEMIFSSLSLFYAKNVIFDKSEIAIHIGNHGLFYYTKERVFYPRWQSDLICRQRALFTSKERHYLQKKGHFHFRKRTLFPRKKT